MMQFPGPFWSVYILEVYNRAGVIKELRRTCSKNDPLMTFIKVVDKPPFRIPGPNRWNSDLPKVVNNVDPSHYIFYNELDAYESASRYANAGAFPVVLDGQLTFQTNLRYLSKEECKKLKSNVDYFEIFHDFALLPWRK